MEKSTTATTVSTISALGLTTNATVHFSQILAAVGNLSLASAIATSTWVATVISTSQAQALAAAAIEQVGGFGVPCTAAEPFLAVPGLVMKTVVGVIYPPGFAVSIQTSMPSIFAMALAPVISSVVTLTGVMSNSSIPVKLQLSAYPLSSARRSGSFVSRRALGCDAGTEWRYTQLGMPLSFACNCPANSLCSGETTCSISPQANDSWMVIKLNTSVCATQSTQTTPAAAVIQALTSSSLPVQTSIPTPALAQSPGNDSLALVLGLGLGLGLPAALAALFMAFIKHKGGKEVPSQPIVRSSEAEGFGQAAEVAAAIQGSQPHVEEQFCKCDLVFAADSPKKERICDLDGGKGA
jgi:hypothetical protein